MTCAAKAARKLDLQIVDYEVLRVRVVGVDAADLGGSQEHRIELVVAEPALDLGLTRHVEAVSLGGQDLAIFSRQSPRDGSAAAVTGNEDTPAMQVQGNERFHRP